MTRPSIAQSFPRSRRRIGSRFLAALLVIPLLAPVLATPVVAPEPAYGDELADARAQQKELQRKIQQQRELVASINASQDRLEGRIASTKDQLQGITEDLASTRRRVAAIQEDITEVQASHDELVASLADLTAQLVDIETQEAAKRDELGVRKAALADRIRDAYEAERTSLLETFLSGASFTDMLSAMSAQLDAAEQDRALAQQIALDRETLLQLHRTVASARSETDLLRQQTRVQKQKLDQRMADLRKEKARLKELEKAVEAVLREQQSQYAELDAGKQAAHRAIAKAAAARKALQRKIDRLVAEQFNSGNIPSQYNGTFIWPMSGSISQDYGCTGFPWEPPYGSCAHFHKGIDIVAPYGTPVRASGAGRVLYCGWNYADGADPAWIVIIAHSSSLTTWYAHMTPGCPARSGSNVRQGEVIGHEGNTGHSTGAHLHWMVQFNGSFVNPRLFL